MLHIFSKLLVFSQIFQTWKIHKTFIMRILKDLEYKPNKNLIHKPLKVLYSENSFSYLVTEEKRRGSGENTENFNCSIFSPIF